MPANYMVRAMGSAPEDFDIFFRESVVAVGWSNVDFTAFTSPDELAKAVEAEYYSDGRTAPQVVGRRKNEVRRFKGIQKGDRIVIPFWSSIRLAVAREEEIFSVKHGMTRDLGNQRVVSYLADASGDPVTVPRARMSHDLQKRLRVRGTSVGDLAEFGPEIDDLFHRTTYTSKLAQAQEKQEEAFKRGLLSVLQDGGSALRAGGIGLECLVAELLRGEGYHATVQAKNRFHDFADADIEATKDDPVTGTTKLLVQVKHHCGESSDWGARQLARILEVHPDLFAEYQLVLVTSADASAELRNLCEARDIKLIAGRDLAGWVADRVANINPAMRLALRISDAPQLIPVQSG